MPELFSLIYVELEKKKPSNASLKAGSIVISNSKKNPSQALSYQCTHIHTVACCPSLGILIQLTS